MSKKSLTTMLALLIIVNTMAALAGPETSVRGGSRDRVAVLSAKDFNLDRLEGRVVLVGFWQAQCEQCTPYIDWLSEMQATHGEEGLTVVAVNQDRDESAALDLMNRIHPRVQIVFDPTGRLKASYQLENIPSTFLHDRNLELQEKFNEFVPEETEALEKAIVKLLAKKYKD